MAAHITNYGPTATLKVGVLCYAHRRAAEDGGPKQFEITFPGFPSPEFPCPHCGARFYIGLHAYDAPKEE